MSDEKPPKIDPQYPTGGGLSTDREMAVGAFGAVASAVVPLSGPVLQSIIKAAISGPLEKRRAVWFNELGEGLRELQDRFDGFDPDRLAEDEEFVSVVAETTRIALTTHRTEKLEALRNVVLNTAAGIRIDEVLESAFLGYVDRFSGLHLRVLKLLSNPTAHPDMVAKAENTMAGSLGPLILAGIPEAVANEDLIARVVADLEREGLTDGAGLNVMMSGSGLLAKRTSALGDDFLRFIASPTAGIR